MDRVTRGQACPRRGTTNTTGHRLTTRHFAAALAALLVTACGGGGDTATTTSTPPVASTRPASAGDTRTVADGEGASVDVPADLDTTDPVTVEGLTDPDGLPPTGDPAAFLGGIALGPEGLTFDAPVTITIPLIRSTTPGRRLRLYHWDERHEGWEETDFTATVAADGVHAVGEVTHFSYYILQPSAVSSDAQGVFGDPLGAVRRATAAGADEAAATLAVYQEVVANATARFPLFEKRPFDLPIPNGYNCYAPVGIYFSFYHGGVDGDTQPLVETVGTTEEDDVEFRIDYFRDIDVYAAAGETQNQVVGFFAVQVYWHSFPPDLTLTTEDDILWPGESTGVRAEVMCGDRGMHDRTIDLTVTAPSPGVSVEPDHGSTNGTGRLAGRLSTTDEASGTALVTATHEWTSQKGDVTTDVVDTAEVDIRGITGTWTVTGRETWTGCQEPTDDGTYRGTGDFRIVQTGRTTFVGGGDFPRQSDRFDGTITWNDDAFTVSGTSRYTERYPICGDDGCTDWIVAGTLEFRGTGSVTTDTIDFTWHGQDLRGDTCSFSGKGTATRGNG